MAASSTWSRVYLQSLLNPLGSASNQLETSAAVQAQCTSNARVHHHRGTLKLSVEGRRSTSRSDSRDAKDCDPSRERRPGTDETQRTGTTSTECFRAIHPTSCANKVSVRTFQYNRISQDLASVTEPSPQTGVPDTRQAVLLMQRRSRCLSAAISDKNSVTASASQCELGAPGSQTTELPLVHKHRRKETSSSSALQQAGSPVPWVPLVSAATTPLPYQPVQQTLVQPLQQCPPALSQQASPAAPAHSTQLQGAFQPHTQNESDDELDSQASASSVYSLPDDSTLDAAVPMTTASSSGLDCDDSMSIGTSQTASDSFADTDSFQGTVGEGYDPLPLEGSPHVPLLGPPVMGLAPTVDFLGRHSASRTQHEALAPLK